MARLARVGGHARRSWPELINCCCSFTPFQHPKVTQRLPFSGIPFQPRWVGGRWGATCEARRAARVRGPASAEQAWPMVELRRARLPGGGWAVGEKSICYNICPPGAFPCDPWQHKGHVPLYLLRLCTPSVRHRVADVRAQHILSAAARSRRRDGHALVQQRACTVLHL